MKIKIRLIGRYKDISGKSEFIMEVPEGDSIWHVVDMFIKQYPSFEKDKCFMIVSQNGRFTTLDEKINEGDEVMIAPPVVSGG